MVDGVIDIPLPGRPLARSSSLSGGTSSRADSGEKAALGEFLAGPENRLVEVAVAGVLDADSADFDPIVFHGPPGTGKSHLTQGLLAAWKARHPRRRAVGTTGVDFARELAHAIEAQAMDEFRHRYRKARLLVLEDLGDLAKRPAAQEELIHTLDALLAASHRVIITARAPIREMGGLLPALQSRLISGLSVPLSRPGPAARRIIIERLAELHRIELPDTAARLLAEGLDGTVRELAGALMQLDVPARMRRGAIDADSVRAFLARRNGRHRPELAEIGVATARCFSLKLSELRGASRRRTLVVARGVAMLLARRLTALSLEQIGQYFGKRDHTTVMHACRKTETLLKTDPAVRQAVEKLLARWQPT